MQHHHHRALQGGGKSVSVKLTAVFRPPRPVSVEIDATHMGVTLGTPVVKEYVDVQTYTGEYVVTPSASEQIVLNTSGKRMADDVTVREVPYYEVSNESGKTVYIADTIND